MYEFKVDLNGDVIEDLTYRITFDERDAAGEQRFVLRKITGAKAQDPDAPRQVVAEGTTGEPVTTPSGLRIWLAKPETRSGSSLTFCTQSDTPFRMAPTLISATGPPTRQGTCSPVTPCIRSCWKCPTTSCSPTPDQIGASESGRWRRLLLTQAVGVRSIASACR